MDNGNNSKAWLWRKISAEKNVVASDKYSRENDDEVQTLLAEKAELEKDLKALEDKLSSALSECAAKDELSKKHVKMAQESINGWEKAKEEAASLKSQLDESLTHRLAGEERVRHLDTALKECMEQLLFVREEQEQRIRGALAEASIGFERTRLMLEESLSEATKRLSKAAGENSHLVRTLLLKDKLVEELAGQLSQVEEDFGSLVARLEATEKDNASFKYEVLVLEKELEIRNEEREFNRRTAEASRRQLTDGARKIAKLESELRRLRVLVGRRLPGPAALAEMRNEVQMLAVGDESEAPRGMLVERTGESWASDSVSGTESGRNEKLSKRGVGAPEMNLMEDFVEMEKLAIVSNEAIPVAVPLESEYSSESTGAPDRGKFPIWLQDSLKLVLDQNRTTRRSFSEIIEEIRVALDHVACPKPHEVSSPSPVNSSRADMSNLLVPSDRRKSIYRMIELIEGLGLASTDYDNPENFSRTNEKGDSETPEGYVARVLQWKTSELTTILRQFVLACYDLLNGRVDLDEFVRQLSISLEWIINHCFSLQDVSSMRDAIIKQCDWDDCESEVEVGTMRRFPGTDIPIDQTNLGIRTIDVKCTKVEERRIPNSERKELEGKLQLVTETSDGLREKLRESDKVVDALVTELEASRKERAVIEDQIELQKAMNEDLDTQLTVTRQELNEARQQFSSLEVELENKSNCFEELQATCVELELQLESMKKESPEADHSQVEKHLRTDQEITTASERLAECQETILNLGKQLKALSAPGEGAIFDKIILARKDSRSTMPTIHEGDRMTRRTSLLDRMLADDGSATGDLKSPETKEIDSNSTTKTGPFGPVEPLEKILVLGTKNQDHNVAIEAMAIVSNKRSGGGGVSLLKKLLWRKKKGSVKKTALSLASS